MDFAVRAIDATAAPRSEYTHTHTHTHTHTQDLATLFLDAVGRCLEEEYVWA